MEIIVAAKSNLLVYMKNSKTTEKFKNQNGAAGVTFQGEFGVAKKNYCLLFSCN